MKKPKEKQKTKAELLREIEGLKTDVKTAEKMYEDQIAIVAVEKAAKNESNVSLKEARGHFADLKQRLVAAELENQRLRGYIQRVQEDDVVREELVMVGDPAGDQQLVPKRKSTVFAEPQHMADAADSGNAWPRSFGEARERKKPRHWVTY